MQSLSELKWCATRALVCTALLSATALAESTNAPAPPTPAAATPTTPAVTSKPAGDTPPPPPAPGGPGGPGAPGGPGGGGGGRRMMRYDKNNDGIIDAAEKAEMPEPVRKMYDEMMEKFDTNKDGKLDDTERAAMRAAGGFGRNRPPGDAGTPPPEGGTPPPPGEGMRRGGFNRPAGELGIMKKFDKNDDGKIDAEERAAMPPQVMALWDEWIVQHPQGAGAGPGGPGGPGGRGGPGRGPLEMMKRFDTNNDGVIDDKEKAAMPEEVRTRYEEFMVRFDTNKNGKIDEDERAVIVQTFSQQRPPGAPPGPPPEGGDAGAPPPPPKSDADKAKIQAAVLKKWDKNGNGKLDDDEKQQMKADSLPKYDKNGDGQLNAEERAAMEKDLLDGK